MNLLPWIYLGLASYLLGAIPFGYLISKSRGIDIRKQGSGNIGATNVFRTVGKTWGILTFVCDFLKGFIPAFLFPIIAARYGVQADPAGLSVLGACMAVIGHNWPVYLGFKGGKGVATSAGALLGLAWQAMLVGLGAWVVIFVLTRYVSVASIATAAVVGVCGWLFYMKDGLLIPITLSVLAVLTIVRHKSNIQRLLSGTEHRFQFGRKSAKPAANE